MSKAPAELRHVISDAPRVMVVDGSKLVRKLIGDVLIKELPNVEVIGCAGLEEARPRSKPAPFHLVTTALILARRRRPHGRQGRAHRVGPGLRAGDRRVRRSAGALEDRSLSEDVTDYFDKGLGHTALAAFIRGYVQPEPIAGARVLYVEDSRVVALATKRMLERQGLRSCTPSAPKTR